jgi:hypothetical protein
MQLCQLNQSDVTNISHAFMLALTANKKRGLILGLILDLGVWT